MAAIILAGGENQRIGENKALLQLKDKPLIQHMVEKLYTQFDKLYVVAPEPEVYAFLDNVNFVQDQFPQQKGTLQALYSALLASGDEHNFVFAGDMPYLNLKLLGFLWEIKNNYEAIVPYVDFQKVTLHTIYTPKCLPLLEKSLEQSHKKISRIFRDLNIRYVQEEIIKEYDPNLLSFFHIKTYLDYLLVQKDFN